MGLIEDYIDWRGDLTFEQSPFNEIDNYIISKIGTLDFIGAVPESGQKVNIEDAVKMHDSIRGTKESYLGVLASESILPVVRRLPETKRFKNLWLSGFIDSRGMQGLEQFSALCIGLDDENIYVSYRGTDDTIAGWKENFMMAVLDEVPAQKDALAYLKWASETFDSKIIVGGHSKGGNLAVYASSMADENIRNRIISVYSNDGPGFKEKFMNTSGYLDMKDRIHLIVPQFSLVGMLLNHESEFEIVKSVKMGPKAHDGFLWEVMGASFVRCEKLSKSSIAFKESVKAVLEGMTLSEKREFIDEFFAVFEEAGIETLSEITDKKLKQAVALAASLTKASRTRSFVYEVLENVVKEYTEEGNNLRILVTKGRKI